MKNNLYVAASLFVIIAAGCKKIKLNKVPIADAGPAQTSQLQTDSVTLSGNGTDEDGTIMGYLWSKIAGPNIPAIHTPGALTTRVTGMIAGVYRFQLMVADDDVATGLDTVSVTILPAQLTTVTMQPGTDGQDALVITKDGDNASPNLNLGQHTELVYSKIGLDSGRFAKVLADYCEDLLISANRMPNGQLGLDSGTMSLLLDEIRDPALQRKIVRAILDIVNAGRCLTGGEAGLVAQALRHWDIELHEVSDTSIPCHSSPLSAQAAARHAH